MVGTEVNNRSRFRRTGSRPKSEGVLLELTNTALVGKSVKRVALFYRSSRDILGVAPEPLVPYQDEWGEGLCPNTDTL